MIIAQLDAQAPTAERRMIMSKGDKAYIKQLIKQIVHPYFAEEIADILIAHGMTFKTEPQTNADRIRAMTDEELVEVVPCPSIFSLFACRKSEPCRKCKLDWLKQPVEVGKDGE